MFFHYYGLTLRDKVALFLYFLNVENRNTGTVYNHVRLKTTHIRTGQPPCTFTHSYHGEMPCLYFKSWMAASYKIPFLSMAFTLFFDPGQKKKKKIPLDFHQNSKMLTRFQLWRLERIQRESLLHTWRPLTSNFNPSDLGFLICKMAQRAVPPLCRVLKITAETAPKHQVTASILPAIQSRLFNILSQSLCVIGGDYFHCVLKYEMYFQVLRETKNNQ